MATLFPQIFLEDKHKSFKTFINMDPNKEQSFNFTRKVLLSKNIPCRVEECVIEPRFSSFRIVSHLGKGTFGSVYEASTNLFKKRKSVALKVLKRSKCSNNAIYELEKLIELKNENAIKVLGAFFESIPCIVLEKANCDIYSYCPTEREAFVIFEDLLKGLQYIHYKGYLHCDVKPGNLLVANGRAKLSDFGTITEYKMTDWQQLSRIKCTFAYAPAITLKTMKVNKWTDLYSLAVSIWECIAQRPFLTPRGKWFDDCIKHDATYIQFYRIVHEYGRFVEQAPNYVPIVEPMYIADFKTSNGYSTVLTEPGWFKKINLKLRVLSGLPTDDWNNLFLQIMNLHSNLECELVDVETIYSTWEYKRLRSKLIEQGPYFNTLLTKVFVAETMEEKRTPSLHVPAPALTDENLNLALNFYYLDREEFTKHDGLNIMQKKKVGDLSEKLPQSIAITAQPFIANAAKIMVEEPKPGTSKQVRFNVHENSAVSAKKVRKKRQEDPSRENKRVEFEGATRFKCRLCGQVYRHAGSLSRHKLKHRPDGKQYKCLFCGSMFTRSDELDVHLRRCKCNTELNEFQDEEYDYYDEDNDDDYVGLIS